MLLPASVSAYTGAHLNGNEESGSSIEHGPNGAGGSLVENESEQNVALAIVGMSLQFPDDANTPESFWSMIMEGRCASREFPPDRLNGATIYHPDPTRGDSIAMRGGHFINEKLGAFDAPFFNISVSEATSVDPHSRALLETTYRALENAGIPIEQVAGSRTSCYTGNLSTDYRSMISQDLEQMSKQSINSLSSLLSGRLGWFFNFQGPNLTLDTACSSGFVALDLGCKSLYDRSADMSIVTGCCLLFSQELYQLLGNMGMLSPDSKSYSFDHRGNGYGRGEGIAALVVKRLPDALRDGDTIRAVIRSIGTNHDGRTPSISYPNKYAQTALIRETYAKAGLSMSPTRYFEAHGTGTPIGDPIEAQAIGAAFLGSRSRDDPLFVGSVKPNVGHLEGASGLASVIKACLILENGTIPPSANFEKLNPRIDDVGLNMKFATKPVPWPTKGLRRISANSFGASGTNAHIVLDDAYHYLTERGLQGNHCTLSEPCLGGSNQFRPIERDEPIPRANGTINGTLPQVPSSQVLLLSAADKPALQRTIDQLEQWFKSGNRDIEAPSFVASLAYTLSVRRSLLPHRSFAIVDSIDSVRQLKANMSSPIRSAKEPQVGFVFTGQGAQWAGMGRELLRFPIFRDNVLESNRYLQQVGFSWDIWDVLRDTNNKLTINRPLLAQTLCTTIQIALCDLFQNLDLLPAAVVGHSSGEIGAAYCAGAISKHSALKLAYYRGVYSEELTKDCGGGMMAVGLSAEQVQPMLTDLAASAKSSALCVACINSPESVTISGNPQKLDELAKILSNQQVFHRRLHVDVAYHSPYMEPVASGYAQSVSNLTSPKSPGRSALMISSVTGDVVEHTRLRQVDYWVQNMLQPVRFSDAVTRLCCPPGSAARKKLDGSHRKNATIQLLVEVGPHAALQGPIHDTLKTNPAAARIHYYSALKRNNPADRTVLAVLGFMACHGRTVNLERVNNLHDAVEGNGNRRKVLVNLPEYPFDHSHTYMPNMRLSKEFRNRRHVKMDLVGRPVMDWNPHEAKWRNFLKIHEIPWAGDHKINEAVIYPAVGMVVMAVEAAKQLADPSRVIKGYNLTDIYFLAALTIPETPEGIETNLCLRPLQSDSGRNASMWAFSLYSYSNENWVKNCYGKVQLVYEEEDDEIDRGNQSRAMLKLRSDAYRTAEETAKYSRTSEQYYDSARKSGYKFGRSFYRTENLTYSDVDGPQCTATISCFPWHTADNRNHRQEHVVHPCTVDGILQICVAAFSRAFVMTVSTAIPIEIESLWISNSGLSHPETESIKCVAKLGRKSTLGYETSATAFDLAFKKILLDLRGGKFRFVAKDSPSVQDQASDPQLLYTFQWKPDLALLGQEGVSNVITKERTGQLVSELCVQGPLLHYLELATFKAPNMKILNFSSEHTRSQEQLLEIFHPSKDQDIHGLSHAEYILVTMSQPSEEDLKSTAEKHEGIKIVVWDGNETLPKEIAESEIFDLMLIPRTEVTTTLISRGHQILKNGGKVILYETGYSEARSSQPNGHLETSLDELKSKFDEHGFSTTTAYPEQSAETSKLIISTKGSKRVARDPMYYTLVIEGGSSHQKSLATALQRSLQESGFDSEVRTLQTLQRITDGSRSTYIFLGELEHPLVEDITTEFFTVLQQVLISAKGILWLTGQDESGQISPSRAIIDGLSRVIRAENDQCVFVTASLENSSVDDHVRAITALIQNTDFGSTDKDYESEYKQKNSQFHIGRMIKSKNATQEVLDRSVPALSKRLPLKDCPPVTMSIGTPGLLDTLHFIEDESYHDELQPNEVEVKVDVIGVNFKDLLLALGRVDGTTFGHECAGTVSRVGSNVELKLGERVCTVGPTAFSTFSRVNREQVARVPDALSLEHAVCVPTQLGVAYYGIRTIAKLKAGERILIHSAAGGTGQWAVQISQRLGAEVFATVGSDKKKKFLMEHYNIPEHHIFSSRNVLFAKGILRMTNNYGVDVVLNSLAGELLLESWNIIAPYGRFIEIGRKDIAENANLPMRPFLKDASFTALEISNLTKDSPSTVSTEIESIFQDFVDGVFKPVYPLEIMPISEVEKSFRMLQEGNMMGKVVLKMTDDSVIPTVLKAKPSFFFNKEKTYVIAGGTGGLGRAIATWMVKERGAKYLILLSRSGLRNEAAARLVSELNDIGVTVEAPECDICDVNVLKAVLDRYQQKMPPIGGCFQASMILRDATFENMSFIDWKTSVDPKVRGSWNLHSLLPTGLDFFIMLSSVSGIIGNPGQSNYAAGNTFLDALARYRVSRGERAVALDLGALLGHGVLAEDDTLRDRLLKGGLLVGISPALMFGLLDYYCDPKRGLLSEEDSQVAIGLAPPSRLRSKASNNPSSSINLPFYGHLLSSTGAGDEEGKNAEQSAAKYRQEFLAADTLTKAGEVVSNALVERLFGDHSITAASGNVDFGKPMHDHGVDSLMAIELRAWLAREFAADVPIFEILGEGSWAALGVSVALKSRLWGSKVAEAA